MLLKLLANPARLEVPGRAVAVGGRRLALLAYLALERPAGATRDEMCDVLWNAEPGADPQHGLRELLYQTSQLGPGGLLRTQGRLVVLASSLVQCDVSDFREALAGGRLEEAVAIYEADFFTGAVPSRAGLFQEWVDGYAAKLREEAAQALQALVHREQAAGRFQAAALYAERLWRCNEYEARCGRLFIESRWLAGDRAGALAAVAAVESGFSELGEQLPHDVHELVARIRQSITAPQHVDATHEPPPLPDRRPSRSWKPALLGAATATIGLYFLFALNRASARVEPRFGGGGTIIVGDTRGWSRALRVTGLDYTDTAAARHKSVSAPEGIALFTPDRKAYVRQCRGHGPVPTVCLASAPAWQERPLTLPGENRPRGWSPDGKWMVLISDRGAGENYNYDVFAVDTASGVARRLTHDPYQNNHAEWSPDGSRLAYRVRLPDRDSVFVSTLDGLRVLATALEGEVGPMRWSPDGQRLALLLQQGSTRKILVIGAVPKSPLVVLGEVRGALDLGWSPDGSLVAVAAVDQRTSGAVVFLPVDQRGPVLRWNVPAEKIDWLPAEPSQYVHTIRAVADRVTMRVGERIKLAARALDAGGNEVVRYYLQLHSADPRTGWIDSLQTFRATAAGRTTVLLSAGGWRSDTVVIDVLPPEQPQLVLHESWEEGLDTTRWKLFGEPLPLLVRTAAGHAFKNNGDSKYPSGVVTRAGFSSPRGFTVEWRQSTPLTGDYWQEIWTDLLALPLDSFRVTVGEPYPPSNGAALSARTPLLAYQPPSPLLVSGCRGGSAPIHYPREMSTGRWHAIAIQLHADGSCDVIVDGRVLLSAGPDEPVDLNRPHRLAIGGRSYRTEILVDDVRVWIGPRWLVLPDGSIQDLHTARRSTSFSRRLPSRSFSVSRS